MAIDDAAFPLNPLGKRMRVSCADQAASQHRASAGREAIFHTATCIHVSKYPHRGIRRRVPMPMQATEWIAKNAFFSAFFSSLEKRADRVGSST